MKHLCFQQSEGSIRSQIKKEQERYLLALEANNDSGKLQAIKSRMLLLQAQLSRSAQSGK